MIASTVTSSSPATTRSVSEARAQLAAAIEPIAAIESVPVPDCLGRVLAADLVSPIDVPGHDNCALDGYAFNRATLFTEPSGRSLRRVGTARAGRPLTQTVGPGECVQVMTGAVLPPGCDTVAPIEHCEIDGDQVVVPADLAPGDNCRRAGEDLRRGGRALARGQVLRPAELGLVASLGVATLAVRRRLRVAFFSTGDELRSLGTALGPGEIYDSNRYTLRGMLTRLDVEPIDMGVVGDRPDALEQALRQAAASADAIITSGGVGASAADHIPGVMARLGRIEFWQIAMRPGRPMAFGRIEADGASALLFGLPGNPVAVMTTFYLFVREALLRLAGAAAVAPATFPIRCAAPIAKRPGRTEYPRGQLGRDAQGRAVVRAYPQQGSGVLRSMSEADCFIVLDHDRGPVAAGEVVDVVPFAALT